MGTPSLKSRMTPRTSFRAVLCVWALVLAVACGPHLGAGLSSWSCTVSTGAPGGDLAWADVARVGLFGDAERATLTSDGEAADRGVQDLFCTDFFGLSYAEVANAVVGLRVDVDWTAGVSNGGGAGPLPISPWPQVSVAQVSNLAGRL